MKFDLGGIANTMGLVGVEPKYNMDLDSPPLSSVPGPSPPTPTYPSSAAVRSIHSVLPASAIDEHCPHVSKRNHDVNNVNISDPHSGYRRVWPASPVPGLVRAQQWGGGWTRKDSRERSTTILCDQDSHWSDRDQDEEDQARNNNALDYYTEDCSPAHLLLPTPSASSSSLHNNASTQSHSSQHTVNENFIVRHGEDYHNSHEEKVDEDSASTIRLGPPRSLNLDRNRAVSTPRIYSQNSTSFSRALHIPDQVDDQGDSYLPLPFPDTSPSPRPRSSISSFSRRSSHIRPIPIRPLPVSHTSSYSSRISPYNIPLPSSSRTSFSRMSNTPIPYTGNPPQSSTSTASTPFTPRRNSGRKISPTRKNDTSPSPGQLASPSGPMSLTSKRRRPPAWPASPRRDESVPSHRELIARSAGLPPLGYAQTPLALKVPPTAQWSPAFHRSGYSRQRHPYPANIPPIPHSADPRRGVTASAPLLSSPRIPDHLNVSNGHQYRPQPPSPAQVTPTEHGTYRYKNVSVAWVVQELNNHAPNVWSSPGTSDCKIVIPALTKRSTAQAGMTETPDSAFSIHSNQPGHAYWPPTPLGTVQPVNDYESGIGRGRENVVSAFQIQRGRRGSLPEHDQVPVLEFPLHQDYLITQSKLLRVLLSSTPSHLDLPVPGSSVALHPPDPDPCKALHEGALKGARMIPTSTGEVPVLFVPLPDPEAFGLIVHWLYWGDANVVEDALSRGLVSWKGLVHNIDYLDLDDPIKRIVGRWWRKWVKAEVQGSRGVAQADEDEDEEDDGLRRARGRGKGGMPTGTLSEDECSERGDEADMDGEGEGDAEEGDRAIDEAMIGALKNL